MKNKLTFFAAVKLVKDYLQKISFLLNRNMFKSSLFVLGLFIL